MKSLQKGRGSMPKYHGAALAGEGKIRQIREPGPIQPWKPETRVFFKPVVIAWLAIGVGVLSGFLYGFMTL